MPASSLSPCSHSWPQLAGKRTTLLHVLKDAMPPSGSLFFLAALLWHCTSLAAQRPTLSVPLLHRATARLIALLPC